MRKRGSLTDETIPIRSIPKTVRSAPVTPCDSETSTWSDRNRSKHGYDLPSGYATSYGNYEKPSYSYDKSGYEASYEASTSTASGSQSKGNYDSGVYEKDYDTSYDKAGYDASYSRGAYEGSTGYDKGNESGYKHGAGYEAEGAWWRRGLGARRACGRCGASSASRPLRMAPCAACSGAAQPAPRPVMSRDRPLLFVKQLFL